MPTVRWYFDFVSPYAYLQSAWLDRFAGRAEIEPVPVLFAGLLGHWGTTGPAELDPKRIWTYRYCQWFADRHDIPFHMPPAHPFNPIAALRLAVAADAPLEPVRAMFRVIWAEGSDPAEPEAWRKLAAAAGLEDAGARIADEAVKARLRANTDAAASRGVFGVPTLEIAGELFWGVDGTDFALAMLDDPDLLDTPEMRRLATLPVGAARRTGSSGGGRHD